jgi:hypothetical protein
MARRTVFDSARQAAIRAEARYAALRVLKAAFKAWSAESRKSQKDLAEILDADPAHISRVLAGDKRSMTIETLFLFARAMNRRPRLEMDRLDSLTARKPNYDARSVAPMAKASQSAKTSQTTLLLKPDLIDARSG